MIISPMAAAACFLPLPFFAEAAPDFAAVFPFFAAVGVLGGVFAGGGGAAFFPKEARLYFFCTSKDSAFVGVLAMAFACGVNWFRAYVCDWHSVPHAHSYCLFLAPSRSLAAQDEKERSRNEGGESARASAKVHTPWRRATSRATWPASSWRPFCFHPTFFEFSLFSSFPFAKCLDRRQEDASHGGSGLHACPLPSGRHLAQTCRYVTGCSGTRSRCCVQLFVCVEGVTEGRPDAKA